VKCVSPFSFSTRIGSWRLSARYLTRHSVLAPKYPAELLRRYAPKWGRSLPSSGPGAIGPLGSYLLLEGSVDEATRSRRTGMVHDLMAPYLRSFEITPTAAGATRELLDFAAKNILPSCCWSHPKALPTDPGIHRKHIRSWNAFSAR
jgi:hypothetical protein